jgi:hypothetical protein
MRHADLWLGLVLIIVGVGIFHAASKRQTAEVLANPARFLSLRWWIPGGLRPSDFQSHWAWQSAWIGRGLMLTGLLLQILRPLWHS